jgi:TRAP-type mannitol/chloroaromatic compound transport system permease small subunit
MDAALSRLFAKVVVETSTRVDDRSVLGSVFVLLFHCFLAALASVPVTRVRLESWEQNGNSGTRLARSWNFKGYTRTNLTGEL